MGEYEQADFRPHPPQAPAAEAARAAVFLDVREAQLHRLAASPVQLLGFGRLHPRLQRLDQLLVLAALERPAAARPAGALLTPRATLAVLGGQR